MKPKKQKADAPTPPPPAPYVQTEADKRSVERFLSAEETKGTPPRLAIEKSAGNDRTAWLAPMKPGAPDNPERGLVGMARLTAALGDVSATTAEYLLNRGVDAVRRRDGDKPEAEINGRLALIADMAPADAHEAVLVSQMVATNAAIMDAHRKLACSDTIQQQDSNGRLLNNLQRTYAAQLEALTRYRNRGKQEVRVFHQHVTVTADKAVVGINSPPGGPGGVDPAKGQPDGSQQRALEYAPGAPMPGALEANREAMPEPGG